MEAKSLLKHIRNKFNRNINNSKKTSPEWPAHTLWSVVEKACVLPRIERPGEKGGDGIFVERTLLDAFLPFNVTLSGAIAFVTAAANEFTRTGKANDLVTYLAGEEDDEASQLPPSLAWEWDRVGHDTATGFAKDCGSQTLTRAIERYARPRLGGQPYCELLKHAHKAACKEYHQRRAGAGSRALAASASAARVVAHSAIFYTVRALTGWVADVLVDAVATLRGQLSPPQLRKNAALKFAKYSLGAALSLALGTLVPFLYAHPYVFLGVEQLVANTTADAIVATLGDIEPS